MVALDGREIDRHKRVETKAPIDFEARREARQQANQEPEWVQEWPDRGEEPAPPGCMRSGCRAPAPNGFVCAGHLRGDMFVPSPEWQEIPDGCPCPPGGEFRMDFETGKNWGRWPSSVAGGAE
jgi:hypothetical protein